MIDAATNAVTATITIGVGNAPSGVAITQFGRRAYIANMFDGSVSVLDTATNTIVGLVLVGAQPVGVAITPRVSQPTED